MFHDARGLALTAQDPRTAATFDTTLAAYCGFRLDTGERLKKLLTEEPSFMLGHVLRGYFMMLFGRRDFVPKALRSLKEAKTISDGTTYRERAHMKALDHWVRGDLRGAIGLWDEIAAETPRDLLALKLAQHGHFYLGDSLAMHASTERALKGWSAEHEGYGWLLGCHAFSLEETGRYQEAERIGREAIEHNPGDVWAGHAVAHVMEMQSRIEEGVAWIGDREGRWKDVNNFIYHVHWHRCLFLLSQGRYEDVLARYDIEVRPESTDDQFDISNAASLLWRLEQLGVDVGGRWQELAERSAPHLADHCLVFADMHYVMATAAAGKAVDLESWRESAGRFVHMPDETEAEIMAEIGLDLGEAIAAHRKKDWSRVVALLLPKRKSVRGIGGSHAQRDLFERLLIDAAFKGGQMETARGLLRERAQLRPCEAWGRDQEAQLGQ